MQHTPHLSQTLELLFKGKLKDTSYPFLEGASPNTILQRCDVVKPSIPKKIDFKQTTGRYHLYNWWGNLRRGQNGRSV